MNLRRFHRRLAVLMGIAALVAFAGGAGFEPLSAVLASIALVTALFWQPDPDLSRRKHLENCCGEPIARIKVADGEIWAYAEDWAALVRGDRVEEVWIAAE